MKNTEMEAQAIPLLKLAKENPWWGFTIEELALITGYSRDVIGLAKANGAKFAFGKCRPEWLMEWMEAHPSACIKDPTGGVITRNK